MFKKILKIAGIVVAVIITVALVFYVKAYLSVEERINKPYAVNLEALEITNDSATLAYGERLITTKGCNDCHTKNLGGKIFIDDPALGLLVASNLTKGNGGLPADYSTDDWLRALKHGLGKDGKPLLFMPSHEYNHLSASDMAAIIAYCNQLPAVDHQLPESDIGVLAYVLTDLGKLPLIPAEMINHSRSLERNVVAEVSANYGQYLAVACQGCHRENMKGGPPVAPGFPEIPDITASGNPGKWDTQEFINVLRTGRTPDGRTLNPEYMPWKATQAYTDLELEALHLYLKSI